RRDREALDLAGSGLVDGALHRAPGAALARRVSGSRPRGEKSPERFDHQGGGGTSGAVAAVSSLRRPSPLDLTRKRRLTMRTSTHLVRCTVDSPLGRLRLVAADEGLIGLYYPE